MSDTSRPHKISVHTTTLGVVSGVGWVVSHYGVSFGDFAPAIWGGVYQLIAPVIAWAIPDRWEDD